MGDGCRKKSGLEGTGRYVDQRNEGVDRPDDDDTSRDKVTKRYRFVDLTLRGSFGGDERIFPRSNLLFLSTKEPPNGPWWWVSLSERCGFNIVGYKKLEKQKPP